MNRLPIFLKPAAKDYLWGGNRLNDDFNLGVDIEPFAEAWVCSTHPDGNSTVSETGRPLSEVLREHPAWMGSHALSLADGELPILVKLIDAKRDLSVQVHPDDEYAIKNEGQLGKTEMWYVLDAKPGSTLVYGFNHDMSAEAVRSSISDGRIERYLNYVPVKKNNLFFIESGIVHAIGEGCLIAEIQENSNLTYRLYDYDREDRNGNKRELHIDKALEVAKLSSSESPRQPLRVLKYRQGCASELLIRCKYFQVERMIINTEIHRELVSYRSKSNSFHVFLVTDGCGSITVEDKYSRNFFKGDCIFIPADSEEMLIHGRAQMLDISC